MNRIMLLSLVSFLFFATTSCQENKNVKTEYLLMVTDTINYRYGYVDQQGDTVIPLGKYDYCFTDTFKTYAIVHKKTGGYYAIDRNEKDLYEVFNFDNGPDYVEEGLFRIIEKGKIGYADAATGKIVIKPQYECAFPFENAVAKVSLKCIRTREDEYTRWESENWIYIDKKGNETDAPK